MCIRDSNRYVAEMSEPPPLEDASGAFGGDQFTDVDESEVQPWQTPSCTAPNRQRAHARDLDDATRQMLEEAAFTSEMRQKQKATDLPLPEGIVPTTIGKHEAIPRAKRMHMSGYPIPGLSLSRPAGRGNVDIRKIVTRDESPPPPPPPREVTFVQDVRLIDAAKAAAAGTANPARESLTPTTDSGRRKPRPRERRDATKSHKRLPQPSPVADPTAKRCRIALPTQLRLPNVEDWILRTSCRPRDYLEPIPEWSHELSGIDWTYFWDGERASADLAALRIRRSIQCLIASDTLLGHCGTDDSWFANFHVPADLCLRNFGSVRYDLEQLASERCGYKLLSLVVALQYHAMKLNLSLIHI